MSEFITDLRDDERGRALLAKMETEIDEIEVYLGESDTPECLVRKWAFHVRRVRERNKDGPTEVYVNSKGGLCFVDGAHIACVRAALNNPIPTIIYSNQEVAQWQLQHNCS